MLNFQELNSFQKVNFVLLNIQLVIGILGIVGNALSICVFLRKSLRAHSFAFYSRIMATCNIIMLAHTARHWAKFFLGIDFNLYSLVLCKINEYQPYVAVCASLWLLFLISVDRLVAIVYPTRLHLFKQAWFQTTLVVMVITYSLLIYIRLPLNYQLQHVHEPNSTETITICYLPAPVISQKSSIYLVNTVLVTIVGNLIINTKVTYFIFLSRKKTFKNVPRHRVMSSKDRHFAVSSIGLNFMGFVFNLPLGLCLFYSNRLGLSVDQTSMIRNIGVTVSIIDNAGLFPINLWLNSIFYHEFQAMLGSKKYQRKHLSSYELVVRSTDGHGGIEI